MKLRNILSYAMMLAFNQSIFAGLATFSPASQHVTPGTIATMDITLTAQQLPNFDSADVVIHALDANVSPNDWAYSQEFLSLLPPRYPGICDPGPCDPSFIFVGGNTSLAGGFGNSILLGALSVDTTGFAPGTYNYLIDFSSDGISDLGWRGDSEPLFGQGVIHVVPEPGMLAMIGLGVATLLLWEKGITIQSP